MRRTLLTVATAVILVLLAVAGPALSARPYRPEPVDFELAPPSEGVVGASAARAVASPPLRAPGRFNLVGLRWRGSAEPAIAMRVRKDGDRWGAWVPVPAHSDDAPDPGSPEPSGEGTSSPVWAGEADYVQYRLSRPVPGLRLHFVNSTGTRTPGDRASTAVRGLANRGLASLARVGAAQAQAPAAPGPSIVPRAAWGGQQYCAPRQTPGYGQVKAAFVHHTVTANGYTQAQAPAAILAICRYHRNSNGWGDIGYNFLVDKYGTIYEGRAGGVDQAVIGAQAQGFNANTTGIANLGTYGTVPQSEAAIDAIARLVRWKLTIHGVPTTGSATVASAGGRTNRFGSGQTVALPRIAGHRDGNATSCPGSALYAQLPVIRQRVGDVQPTTVPLTTGPVRSATRADVVARPRVVRIRGRSRLIGRLRLAAGAPAPGARVQVQRRMRSRGRFVWVTVAQRVTRPDGSFDALLGVPGRSLFRAQFSGDATRRPSWSAAVSVAVRR